MYEASGAAYVLQSSIQVLIFGHDPVNCEYLLNVLVAHALVRNTPTPHFDICAIMHFA